MSYYELDQLDSYLPERSSSETEASTPDALALAAYALDYEKAGTAHRHSAQARNKKER